jgi:antitoxin CptB
VDLKSGNSKAELSELSRTKWQCRRGMLELDILLNKFFEKQYESLSNDQSIVFDTLLDYPDQILYDLLLDKMKASDKTVSELIKVIRKTAL